MDFRPGGMTDFNRAYGTKLHFKTSYPAINRWASLNTSLAGRIFWPFYQEAVLGGTPAICG
jgi:hypothetical protein